MSQVFGVFFEANAIQRYILAGGRLRDVVGASYLVDSLEREVLIQVCAQLGLSEDGPEGPLRIRFPRRAAGALYALLSSERAAVNFAALWSLAVQAHCPLLTFNQVIEVGETEFAVLRAGTARLAQARSLPVPDMPAGTPVTERTPRTGRAMVGVSSAGGGTSEPADAALHARRGVSQKAVQDMDDRLLSPARKLALLGEQRLKVVFPRNLEIETDEEQPLRQRWQFPFVSESRYIALVHADGNGFGQLLLDLIAAADTAAADPAGGEAAAAYSTLLPKLSDVVAECTAQAVQDAIERVLLPKGVAAESRGVEAFWRLPARPIVIAGDDLTMIVRADLAVAFTCAFLAQFEAHTCDRFMALRTEHPQLGAVLPPMGLTACAGIAFGRNNQPFAMLHEVAEDLCSRAKHQVKALAVGKGAAGSAVAWCRITESLLGEELPATLDGTEVLPRLGAFSLGGINHGLPTVTAMEALLSCLSATQENSSDDDDRNPLTKGPLRRILSGVFMQPSDASIDYLRWKRRAKADASGRSRGQLERFESALTELARSAGARAWDKLPAIAWGPDTQLPGSTTDTAKLVLQELIDLLAVNHVPTSSLPGDRKKEEVHA